MKDNFGLKVRDSIGFIHSMAIVPLIQQKITETSD